MFQAREDDVFGFLKSGLDAHTMGVNAALQLMSDCGYSTVLASEEICRDSEFLSQIDSSRRFSAWIRERNITVLETSYRLDPRAGAKWFGCIMEFLRKNRLLSEQGGSVRQLFFAGLTETCRLVKKDWGDRVEVFVGGETPRETLVKSGVPSSRIPNSIVSNSVYDETRLAFGRELIRSGRHLAVKPYDRSGYPEFGTFDDSLMKRLEYARSRGELPLFRAHMGPYLEERKEALQMFYEWVRKTAEARYLDILSIGSSQLTQSDFGEDWAGKTNGGGVPINSEQEFRMAWDSARPMLVRTYAGTKNLPELARMYNRTINNAWHALSLWWFCQLDGRGELSLQENLQQQFAAIDVVVRSGKPFEPNVPHHFAFRGADDVTYVVSTVLAARVAKKSGVRTMVLQNMLNTPSNTWGVQDLAKARAVLRLVGELTSESFKVIYQPRAGLGYFAPDLEKAKVQLAATTALMDDVDPHDESCPEIIHVVSYSEALFLATPEVISESIQITRCALAEYRRLRRKGLVDDMTDNDEVRFRMEELVDSARKILAAIDATIPNVETPAGLYRVFKCGFLPVPDLMGCRDEFPLATMWKTRFCNGGYRLVSGAGDVLSAVDMVSGIIDRVREGNE